MEEEKEFTVRDRRGSAADAASDEAPKQQETGSRSAPGPSSPGAAQEPPHDHELDFSTFVISLATSVQMNLGAIPHPETDQTAQNIPAAKQMIDILALLKEKTKGNLSEQESALLDQVLYNLRIHYVRAVEGQK